MYSPFYYPDLCHFSFLQTDPDFDLDIRDDVQDECSKFGAVKHIFVDK